MLSQQEKKLKLEFITDSIKEKLAVWAEEQEILHPGQSLVFDLEVVWRSGRIRAPVEKISARQMQRVKEFKPENLSGEEWKQIEKINNWYDDQWKIIANLRKRRNRPTKWSDLSNRRRRYEQTDGFRSTINYRLSKAGVPYKLVSDPYNPGYYALVKKLE